MSAEEALCAIGDDVSDDESRSSDAEVDRAMSIMYDALRSVTKGRRKPKTRKAATAR